ncbi:MAG: hypothetical protein J0H56_05505 [Micrococcales bacterium]|nr:hypothetical protein [Micrococcales bacterium]
MSQITRSWLAFAAMGAGVIHLGVAPGTAIPAAVVLGVLGLAEFAWGVGVLARNRFLMPRVALVGAFAPVIGWGFALLAAVAFDNPELASAFGAFPMAVASFFNLVIAAVLGADRRRTATVSSGSAVRAPKPRRQAPACLYLTGLMVGALAVSMLTTPALAATGAGINNPHANHGELDLPEQHHH